MKVHLELLILFIDDTIGLHVNSQKSLIRKSVSATREAGSCVHSVALNATGAAPPGFLMHYSNRLSTPSLIAAAAITSPSG